MTIMVTGAFGFVGLNIVEALLGRGETVVALGLGGVPAEAEAEFRDLPGKLVAIEADVTTEGVIAGAMAAHALDRLIHTAAITAGYEREKATPAKVFEINLLGTVAAIQAARDNAVKKIVSFSSSSVYGNGADAVETVDEATTWPRMGTIYAISKYAAERTALRLGELWDLDVSLLRPGAVYGPFERDTGARDTLSAVLQVTRMARAGTPVVLQRRAMADWVYGPDVAGAALALLDDIGLGGRVYNIACGPDKRFALEAWGKKLEAQFPGFTCRLAEPSETGNVELYGDRERPPLSVSALARDTGFVPAFGLNEAFAHYLPWIDKHPTIFDT
jgi:nucleoside-diphosphate-sugar epimerase